MVLQNTVVLFAYRSFGIDKFSAIRLLAAFLENDKTSGDFFSHSGQKKHRGEFLKQEQPPFHNPSMLFCEAISHHFLSTCRRCCCNKVPSLLCNLWMQGTSRHQNRIETGFADLCLSCVEC